MFDLCWMNRRHMPDVLRIEKQSNPHPRDEETFLRLLRDGSTIGRICETKDGEVVGFSLYDLRKKSVEIRDISVASAWRLQEVGTTLIEDLKSKLAKYKLKSIRISLNERNVGGQIFLKSHGFKAMKIKRLQYDEDAEYRFVYQVNEKVPV